MVKHSEETSNQQFLVFGKLLYMKNVYARMMGFTAYKYYPVPLTLS
jgi:hypothetical protein